MIHRMKCLEALIILLGWRGACVDLSQKSGFYGLDRSDLV